MRTPSRTLPRLFAILAACTLLIASCSSGDSDDDEAAPDEETTTTEAGPINQGQVIDVVDFGFDPDIVTVVEGEVVTFVNTSETTTHAIQHIPSEGQDILFETTRLGPGEQFTVMPGIGPVEYICQIHPETMHGGFTVVSQDDAANGGQTATTATE